MNLSVGGEQCPIDYQARKIRLPAPPRPFPRTCIYHGTRQYLERCKATTRSTKRSTSNVNREMWLLELFFRAGFCDGSPWSESSSLWDHCGLYIVLFFCFCFKGNKKERKEKITVTLHHTMQIHSVFETHLHLLKIVASPSSNFVSPSVTVYMFTLTKKRGLTFKYIGKFIIYLQGFFFFFKPTVQKLSTSQYTEQ